jgi:ATP-dependent Lon protease
MAYLLYDLLSNDSNGTIDTQEQTIIFDSFPWYIKQCFKNAMKKTVQYTNELSNFDLNKVPLEQQICLMKASDSVKEKAMAKLKEIKAKSEDSGTKSRQYLDSLLKIPFGVFKREPILNIMNSTRLKFKELFKKYEIDKLFTDIPNKEKYTSIEICKYLKKIDESIDTNANISDKLCKIKYALSNGDKNMLRNHIMQINELLKKYKKSEYKLKCSTLNKEQMKNEILKFFELLNSFSENNKSNTHNDLIKLILDDFFVPVTTNNQLNLNLNLNLKTNLKKDIHNLNDNLKQINEYMKEVKNILDRSVHGHDKAKKQVEHVIAQWINSDGKQNESHVLGFEGNPGVGKTTLAKGLAECLKDENGNARPYSLIALGGDSNASTLCGHNFTYVGSNYGSIVQILIDKKCMNPIIVFDEVDKISRTEQGREITGILTHLLDPTQNNAFQDKYFSGIDLDLSKILFILSYNDVNAIDKILLDRINRIKFDSLTIEDKVVICNRHLLPDLYKKIGLEDMIYFSDETLKFIIEEYTLEPGVRKLKELLFYIVGEINLNIFKELNSDIEIPINITIEDIKTKYFKDKRELLIKKVPDMSLVGYANGMYATSLGTGGTLPIHAKMFPSQYFLELKLTGMQQDVMKESMHVALTVAWNLTSDERKKVIRHLYDNENNKYGINVHTGDGAVSKDGPSAGSCITLVLYSLLNDIPIKAKFGITGEIQMSGEISAIGGLNHKILGSIKAGIDRFIYPKENDKDFKEFYEKYKDDHRLKNVKFYEVSHIKEVLELLLDK